MKVRQSVKAKKVGDKKRRDPSNQPDAVDPTGNESIGGHDDKEQERLSGGSIAFDRGSALRENERFAHGLYH